MATYAAVRVKETKMKELLAAADIRWQQEMQREAEIKTWSQLRRTLLWFFQTKSFESLCGVIILFNMVLVVIETDENAKEGDPPRWLSVSARCLLAVYTGELLIKLFAMRLTFFEDFWNVMDSLIVGLDLLLYVLGMFVDDMPFVSILRVFRLARLSRAVKAAQMFNELHSLIRSFGCALKAIFWGMLIVLLVLVLFGIMAVQLIHPVNQRVAKNKPHLYEGCARCDHAFATVFDSAVTFWKQLVMGDSWGQVSEPIIEEAPWTSVFFMLVGVSLSIMLLNLILAVMIEAGANAATEDEHQQVVQKEQSVARAEHRLIDFCRGLDADGSGSLNIEEFMNGFRSNKDFKQCLQIMNATEADINMIFNICDEDGSGDVDYHEFVEQIRRIKHSGEKMLLNYVTEIRHTLVNIKNHVAAIANDLHETGKFGTKHYASDVSQQHRHSCGKCEHEITCVPMSPKEMPGHIGANASVETDVLEKCPSNIAQRGHVGTVLADIHVTDKLDRIKQITADVVAILNDVAEQSKTHSRLLTTLVDRNTARSSSFSSKNELKPARTPPLTLSDALQVSPHPNLCCGPPAQHVKPQRSDVNGSPAASHIDHNGLRISGQFQPASWSQPPECVTQKV